MNGKHFKAFGSAYTRAYLQFSSSISRWQATHCVCQDADSVLPYPVLVYLPLFIKWLLLLLPRSGGREGTVFVCVSPQRLAVVRAV